MDESAQNNPQVPPDVEACKVSVKESVNDGQASDVSRDRAFKWFVLVFLVFQNSAASLLMRYSRSESGASWNPQTGVVMQEIIKALTCVALLLREGGLSSVFADRTEALKTSIPAICYLVQNNMQYVAVGYLDASTYAVLYQLKIMTTALLSVAILRKQLACIQWVSLGLLTVGVSAVVLSQMAASGGDDNAAKKAGSIVPGLIAVLTACVMSGLAGVYFEKLLKGSNVSLWARNLQLALYSIAIGLVGLLGDSANPSFGAGFFHGYTTAVWCSILNNAFGGLLVAVVIKYADVIMKNFAASGAIVVTAIVSVVLLGSSVNGLFVVGVALVIYAMFLYGKVDPLELLKGKLFSASNAVGGVSLDRKVENKGACS